MKGEDVAVLEAIKREESRRKVINNLADGISYIDYSSTSVVRKYLSYFERKLAEGRFSVSHISLER